MRDIKRIDRICKKLAQLGKEYPDERFGQFMVNHIFNDGKDPGFKEDIRNEGVPDNGITGEEIIDKEIEEQGKIVFDKKPKTPEPKEPEGKDYIKDLK